MGKTITVRTETEKFRYVGEGFDNEEFEIEYIYAINSGLLKVKAGDETYHVDAAFALQSLPEVLRERVIVALSNLALIVMDLDV